jgi:hypothetical protein
LFITAPALIRNWDQFFRHIDDEIIGSQQSPEAALRVIELNFGFRGHLDPCRDFDIAAVADTPELLHRAVIPHARDAKFSIKRHIIREVIKQAGFVLEIF